MSRPLYDETLDAHRCAVEEALPTFLPAEEDDPVRRAMVYACADGGKRLRPVLTLEFCRLCGGDTQRALPFACAVEMIHAYSLIHDDLPCMDDSPLRRGKPSVHAAFGENMALLAGDALLTRAFEIALRPVGAPAVAQRAAFVLARAAGIDGMVGGQVLDLQSEGRTIPLDVLERLQEGKTAALIVAACRMGAIVGGATPEEEEAAAAFGRELGLCFQIVDDILDVTSTDEVLGKPTGSDAGNGKTTYVSLLGLEAAKELAARRTAKALEALAVFSDTMSLRILAEQLLERDH